DVYIAVAGVAAKRGFVFAKALDQLQNKISIRGLYHPQLKSPISNTIEIDENSNIIFLTGANMAGKSTFMKSFGISIFLAHIGFPLPVESMEFTLQSGMYTTINLPDNLSMGYSHFYAEVLRLKKVAEQVSRTQNLVIIFDELFRGTNVKDAYDATVAVTEAFARKRNCTFVISTHIIEAGETLKELCGNINFVYLPTVMEGSQPVYTYKLKAGITNDRHGMMIINNEHILEIIKGSESFTK
ncbi:MAG: DNA mismatch repair protein, partial [Odoribacter sp.]